MNTKNKSEKIQILFSLLFIMVLFFIGSYYSWNNVVNASGHSHTYGKIQQHSSSQHKRVCTVSGCGKTTYSSHDFGSNKYFSETNHKKSCSDCGYSVYSSHSWKDATCTTPKKCSGCNSTAGSAKGHKYEDSAKYYSETNHRQECTRSGCSYAVYSSHNCAISKATCTEAKYCSTCKTTIQSALGHSYSKAEYYSETNHKQVCTRSNCGKSLYSAHSYSNNKCTGCGHLKYGQDIPTPEECQHQFKVTKYVAPTCTTKGSNSYKCDFCGKTKTDEITVMGHNYIYEKLDSTNHTKKCTRCNLSTSENHSLKDSTCTKCNYIYTSPEESITPPATCIHTYVWKSIKKATCNEEGKEEYRCVACGKVSTTRTIKVTEHEFDWEIVKKATCNEPGKKSYVCIYCEKNSNKEDIIIPATGLHKYNSDGYCRTCNKFDITKAICKFKGDKHSEYETIQKRESTSTHIVVDTCLICKEIFEHSEEHIYSDGMNCICGATKDTSSCSYCNSTKIVETYALGTTTQNHIVTYSCSSCKKTIATKSEEHIFIDGKCLCGKKRSLTLSTYKVTLMPGESIKVSAIYVGDVKDEISWKSKNTKVATVFDGLIRAADNPTANYVQILVSIDGLTRVIEVTINKNLKANIQLIAPNEAYVGETIALTTTITSLDGQKGTVSWSTSGVECKLTPNSSTHGAWLRASKKGNVTVKVVYEYAEGKTVRTSKTIKILDVNKIVAKEKIAVVVGSVNDLGGSVLKIISGNSVVVLGTSIKAITPGTTILEDQDGNRYEVIVMDKDVELINASISINNTIYLGKTENLTITTNPPLTTSQYKVVASNHFTVDNSGNVKAVKVGKGYIKLVYKNKTLAKQDVEVKLGDATISLPDTIYIGQTVNMSIATKPPLSNDDYTVQVSNKNISVEGNTVTGLKTGKSTISVKIGKSTIGSKNVEVKLAVIDNFSIDKTALFVGQSANLNYQISPKDSIKNCQIVVSNNLSYDASSKQITALKEGNGTIKLTLNNQTLAELKITVQSAIATITASKTAILAGEKITYSLSIEPPNTSYEITANSYLTLDTSSNTITGVKIGKGVIRVKSNGKEIGTLNITVSNPTILLEKNEASVSSHSKGYQIPVTAVTAPGDSLKFTSNSNIVSVSNTGYISINRDKYIAEYGRKTATVKITISLASGVAQKTFTLKVTNYEHKNFYRSAVAIKEGSHEGPAPLIIYIGGQGEMSNNLSSQAANPSIHYLHSDKTYDATTITLKFDKAESNWQINGVNQTIDYVKELVNEGKIDPSQISVVTYSYGGYGGQYAAEELNKLEGFQVNNLVLLDSVQPDYRTKDRPDIEKLQTILDGGTDITVYGSSHTSPGQYGVWDACRDAVAYDNAGKFNESNGQFNGKILEDPAHNGWTKDQEVLDFLDNLAGAQ